MKGLKLYMMVLIVGMCCSCDEYLEVKNYGQVLPETNEDYATLINNQLSAIDKDCRGRKYAGVFCLDDRVGMLF
ncbi:MAG: hypothetical protein ACLSDJ_13035 [Butyricimonas faecihominis]